MSSTLAGSASTGAANGKGAEASFNNPNGVAIRPKHATILVVDSGNHCIRELTAEGETKTLAGLPGQAGLENTGAEESKFNNPVGITASNTAVYVTDTDNHVVRSISPVSGQVTTKAGSGTAGFQDGDADQAQFNHPTGIAIDRDGVTYVADTDNHRIRKIVQNKVTTLAGSGTAGNADGVGEAAQFNSPTSVAIDAAGNVLVGDTGNSRLRKVDAKTGAVTSPHPNFSFKGGVAVDGEHNVIVTDKDNHKIWKLPQEGDPVHLAGAGDGHDEGEPLDAKLSGPKYIAIDLKGNIIVTTNHSVRSLPTKLRAPTQLILGTSGPKSYLDALKRLLNNVDGVADAIFTVNGEDIPAHRNILIAQSEYFRGMLHSGFSESSLRDKIPVEDTTPSAFRAVLRYLYTDEFEGNNEDVVEVMKLSDLYQMKRLNAMCVQHCRRHVSVENVVAWLVEAEEHSLEHLKLITTRYASRNLDAVKKHGEGLKALEKFPDLLKEVKGEK